MPSRHTIHGRHHHYGWDNSNPPALTVAQIRTRARRLKRQHGLSLIIVDYLQLVNPPAGMRNENRVQEVSVITRSLKALAKPRSPQGRGRDPVTVENEQLRKEIARLRQRLKQTETILSIQKKASELLGIPLNPPPIADDE